MVHWDGTLGILWGYIYVQLLIMDLWPCNEIKAADVTQLFSSS